MSTVKSVDENAANFLKIDSGSEAAGTGVDVGLTTDFQGTAVSSPPDIGAFAVASATPDTKNRSVLFI